MLYSGHLACAGFELTTLVVINTDCTGSCESNYLTTTTAPEQVYVVRVWYLSPSEQFYSYIMVRTGYTQCDDDVCFVLDQNP